VEKKIRFGKNIRKYLAPFYQTKSIPFLFPVHVCCLGWTLLAGREQVQMVAGSSAMGPHAQAPVGEEGEHGWAYSHAGTGQGAEPSPRSLHPAGEVLLAVRAQGHPRCSGRVGP